MNSRFLRHLQLSLLTLDFLCINAVYFITQYFFSKELLIVNASEYSYFIMLLNLAWLLVSLGGNIYQGKHIMSFEAFTRYSMYAYLYFLILNVLYLFFFHQFIISRVFITVVLSGIFVGIIFNRFLYLAIYQYFKKKDYLINKVVVIGYNNLSKRLVSYLEDEGINKEIVGYCEDSQNIKELSRYPILSGISNTLDVCKTFGATEIYSTIAPEQYPSIYKLMQMADENCIRFKIVPDISFFVKKKVRVDYLNEIPIISLRNEPLEDLGNRIKKRAFDIVVSTMVIICFLSWMIPLIGLLIWLESRGPIFFMQARSGKDNKSFPCLKFRSMKVNDKANELQAKKNDARVTRTGRFLRRTSLDEFPQFLNVFIGNMSIVGPRPHMLKHTDEYSILVKQYMVRQFLKPGITGWAQVSGYRGETQTVEQMQKRVEHDLWYLENWNPWLDLKIIFLTVFNTLKGEKNAY
ncbi:MAG: undecaprenyl-phosphate glucose phosphotransferase [Chitinophagaceae bacterium]